MIITTLDGPAQLDADPEELCTEVFNAVSFENAYRRPPHRALTGFHWFTITTSGEYRLISHRPTRFWRLSREQAIQLYLELGGDPEWLHWYDDVAS